MINFYRNVIIDTIANNTGMEYNEIIKISATSKISLDRRDYMEIVLRIEAIFDCTLDMLNKDSYEININDLVSRLDKILN